MNARSDVMALILIAPSMVPTLSAGIIAPGVFTGTPDNSWQYSELVSAGHGQSSSYFPSSTAEFSSAIFQGFVNYDPVGAPTAHYWTGIGNDTIQVFSTFVLSNVDQTIPIRVGGDDGHSLFIDDGFVAGGGFGPSVNGNLVLTAGVARKLTVAGYNGPGNWIFGVGLPGLGDTISGPINDVAGIQINAVPEPSSLTLLLISTIVLGSYRSTCRRRILRYRTEKSGPASGPAPPAS